MIERTMRSGSWGRRAGVVLIFGVSLGALSSCDNLLDVDLPAQLTDQALVDPGSADTQVASVLALFHCGYGAFAYHAMGHEEVFESIAGVAGGNHVFEDEVLTGDCDSDSEDGDYGDQLSGARSFAYVIYDKLQEWTEEQVPNKEELSAVSALYAAATLDLFGEHLCELAIDGGPLMGPDQMLTLAEDWIDTSLGHMSNLGGDFEMPFGIASSARTMAIAIRARIRWAKGDVAGALADSESVPEGFVAWVPREAGLTLRNKIYDAGTQIAFSGMLGKNTWWHEELGDGLPNPATGQVWPDPIPFSGYLFLGVMPDGRTLGQGNLPVTWAEEFRTLGEDPTPLNNGAVPDTRVLHFKKGIQGPEPREVPDKYKAESDDIPLLNWKEMWLIRAELRGGQTAIDMVNHLRDLSSLPRVTYADPNDVEEIRYMVYEEKRRELFAEGRFWSTKIQNTDIAWFPRHEGVTPAQGYTLQGGVRLAMPEDEYNLNPNFSKADRGTGCNSDEAPVGIVG